MAVLPRQRCLAVEHLGDLTVIRFTQPDIIDEETSRIVGDHLFALVEQHGRRQIVVNLGSVQRVTSIVVGKLIGLNKRLDKIGGRLALCQLNPVIQQIFDTLRLTRLFHIYKDEPEAMQSF